MNENPYTPTYDGPEHSGGETEIGGEDWPSVIQPLSYAAGWIKLLGVIQIIHGVLSCLTIVGIVVGWLPIWIGILLCKAADNLRSGNIHVVREGSSQLATVFKIVGIFSLVALGLSLVYVLFVIVMVIMFAMRAAPL